MSLIYRGQTAQASTTANTIDTGMTGSFMGRCYSIRKAQQPARRTTPMLQYRGTIY